MASEASPATPAKPRTWAHLAAQRRRPTEYEVVSTNLHYHAGHPDAPYELDPDLPMSRWVRRFREGSPLRHPEWDAFRDPDAIVYRSYTAFQDRKEHYVEGLLEEFARAEHDRSLEATWVDSLARLYAPSRYLLHGIQMGSAYLTQMAPASTISNCATFQAADSLRWLSHVAYRTKELMESWPGKGFGEREQDLWENDPAWQGLRELIERALVSYDWAESFVALNVVAKPVAEEVCVRQLGMIARETGDTLLWLLSQAQLEDAERSRRWTTRLVQFALARPENAEVLRGWIEKWSPLGDAAIEAYCAALPDGRDAAAEARRRVSEFRDALGVDSTSPRGAKR